MSQFLALLKVEFKNKEKHSNHKKGVRNKALQIIKLILNYGIIVFLITALSNFIIDWTVVNGLELDFLIMFIFLVQVIQFVIGLNSTIKHSQYIIETKELMSMPIKTSKLFFVKVAQSYIKQIIYSLVTVFPILIQFAILTSQNIGFYFMIIPVILILPIVPLFLVTMVSFPVVTFIKFLKSKFFVNFLIFAVLIGFGFYAYSNFLMLLIEIFKAEGYTAILSPESVASIQSFTSSFYLQILFKNLLTLTNVFKSFITMISILAFCFVASDVVASKYYKKYLYKTISREAFFKQRITKIKNQNTVWTLIKKEILTVFRNNEYSFSFFTVSMVTPIIVYFTSQILMNSGMLGTGQELFAPLSLLVLLIFMPLITSFAATNVTREGKSFNLTKFIPITAKKQTFAKIVFYMAIEMPAIIISAFVLKYAGFLDFGSFVSVSLINILVAYAGICLSINVDIKKPKFNFLINNTASSGNPNITKSVLMGFTFAFVFGTLGVVLVYMVELVMWNLILIGLAFLLAVLSSVKLFWKLQQKYKKIER